MKNYKLFIGLLMFFPFKIYAQDSLKTFTLTQLFEWATAYHPVVKQAQLLSEAARQEIRIARGAFDPKLDIHWNRKKLWNYKENWEPATYYQNWSNFLKVPLWVGDIKLGYERYLGINVNPENFTPPDGLAFIEFGVPLAQDLIIDERRAALQKAQLLSGLNEAEKIKTINKTLFSCAKDYWSWYEQYNKLQIAERGYRLAEERFQYVKQSVVLGDLAPIDEVEAELELLKRRLALNESRVDFNNARLLLSSHLWSEDTRPLELAEDARPYPYKISVHNVAPETLDSLSSLAQNVHPEIQKLSLKIEQLNVDKRLAKNNLLPRIDVDYKPFWIPKYGETTGKYFSENYKIGFNFVMPLFLRKERGKLAGANIKIQQSHYELTERRRGIQNDLSVASNEVNNFVRLIEIQKTSVRLSERLLQAEAQKFTNGESSLFFINSRERSLLSEKQKLIELEVKYMKGRIHLFWTAGVRLHEYYR